MIINCDFKEKDQHFNDRQHNRKNVSIDAHIRPLGGGKSQVKILDVSETGFLMSTPMILDKDKSIFLTIPGFQSMEAHIIWHRGELHGCTFLLPLYPAILEHISRIFAEQANKNRSL